jgi:predicted  nucleic acid-binding Zn-ribbon protein
MASTAELMREIHRLRRFARDLQEQIDRAPLQHKAQKSKVTRREEEARDNQETIKKLKVSIHEKEVTLKTTHGQIGKHQKQLNEAGSEKEYDALQTEIAAAREKCGTLEEEILAAMSESDERTAKIPELDRAIQTTREELARDEKDSGARLASLQQQLDETQARLKEAEAAIPTNVRSKFDRIVRGKGVDSFAPLGDGNCAFCRTEITAQQYNELLIGNFVVCKSCERILYLPEPDRRESGEGA